MNPMANAWDGGNNGIPSCVPQQQQVPPTILFTQQPQPQVQYPQPQPQQAPPAISPETSAEYVVGQVNDMLNQTEQYLLQQIAGMHQTSNSQLQKALPNAINANNNLADIAPDVAKQAKTNRSLLIAIVVMAAIVLLAILGSSYALGKKICELRTAFAPHGDLLAL